MKMPALHSRERRLLILFLFALLMMTLAVGRQVTADQEPTTPQAIENGSAQAVAYWQNHISRQPQNPDGYAQLGLTYLQQVRTTGDAGGYALAEEAFNTALEYDPHHLNGLIGHGILALARHDFPAALNWGERARAQNPYRAQTLGILVDAYVELGQYDEAVSSAQAMVDLRPDLASYSRVSYLRELHGDVAGAITAMETAVNSGSPGTEQTAWTQVQLGNLYLNTGQTTAAQSTYQTALHSRPEYPYALAGLARVQAATGEYEAAITLLRPLVQRLPLPEFAVLLGDLYLLSGDPQTAAQQYDLVRLIHQLNTEAGVQTDLETALFEANYGDVQTAVTLARAAYNQRPTIYAAEALAWALYQSGDAAAAWPYSRESLRLGTQDARLYFHAGLIARAQADEAAAQHYLATARQINPAISLYHDVLTALGKIDNTLNVQEINR